MLNPELIELFERLKALGALHVVVVDGDQRFEVTFGRDGSTDEFEALS